MFSTETIARPANEQTPVATIHGLGWFVYTVFAVAFSASALTPLIPVLIDNFVASPLLRERHAAYLAASYALAVFTAASVLGALSDRIGRRIVLTAAITMFTLALLVVPWVSGLTSLYASRVLSGLGAGALLPVMMAYISERSAQRQRASRFAWLTTATMIGGLAGPYIGAAIVESALWQHIIDQPPSNILLLPVLIGTFLSGVALIGTGMVIRRDHERPPLVSPAADEKLHSRTLTYLLFGLTGLLMYAVGTFELGLVTLLRPKLQLSAIQLAIMFAECALVMLLVQILFFVAPFKEFATRHMLFPALFMTVIGLAIFPFVDTHSGMIGIIAVIAGGAGVIGPLITLRISMLAYSQQGTHFGLQSAASSLGQALGTAGSGLLAGFNPVLPYWLAAALLMTGTLWTLQHIRGLSNVDPAT